MCVFESMCRTQDVAFKINGFLKFKFTSTVPNPSIPITLMASLSFYIYIYIYAVNYYPSGTIYLSL